MRATYRRCGWFLSIRAARAWWCCINTTASGIWARARLPGWQVNRCRRSGPRLRAPHGDRLQYFNETAYRLVSGRLLIATVLGDAASGLSVLIADERVDSSRVGVLGHSYGGNVTIMLAALDERVRFACASGSACSYRQRMLDRTGIEFAHVIPGILELTDIEQLVELIAPRPLLLLSATEDRYSADTPQIVHAAARAYRQAGAPQALEHHRAHGGHALTQERFDTIVDWVIAQLSDVPR
jgi:dienelactone hydrolase